MLTLFSSRSQMGLGVGGTGRKNTAAEARQRGRAVRDGGALPPSLRAQGDEKATS